jgi:tungstate transport system ATP-binding protein
MNKPLYQLKNIKKMYNGRCVLMIKDLAIYPGEILSIVGPSGAGKSTLLRLLNFLEMPTEGEILFDGQVVQGDMPLAQRRRVTTVFQHPLLLKRTVVANLKYGLALRGLKLDVDQKDYWLRCLGLDSLSGQLAHKLSAGEAQRVALARALLIQPEALLMDEPTANLDPYNVSLIEKIVRAENEKHATTIVLVTHNIFQAQRIAHRTALLLDGKIVEIADTEVFFTTPQKPQTAAFVRGELIY